MLTSWVIGKLEPLRDQPRVLLRDPLQLLPRTDSALHGFAVENGFTLIEASTNLVFRQLFELTVADPGATKILLWDRVPARRRAQRSAGQAPPPFYPDFLATTDPDARIELDLREFLVQRTGDHLWPREVNDPYFAKLIVSRLDGVLRAHSNLRVTAPGRFTDSDFKTIVAYTSLGVADAAFKKLDSDSLWRIALMAHHELEQLDKIVPEITAPILADLRKAPAPFCWFADRDAGTVLRAFYLSVILSQHLPGWKLLLANVDPALSGFSGIDEKVMKEAAPRLVRMSEDQAHRDLAEVEEGLSRENLQLLLIDQLKVAEPEGFASVLEKEEYCTQFRCLALLMALDNSLQDRPAMKQQKRISNLLFPEPGPNSIPQPFCERRPSKAWSALRDAYGLTLQIQQLRGSLFNLVKTLTVKKLEGLTYEFFWEEWNGGKINRLEYYLSALERAVTSSDLLPRPSSELPSAFDEALRRIRQRVHSIVVEAQQQIDKVNARFQDLVAVQYPKWVAADTEVRLTSQFLRRCLKPYWDPTKEKAVLFIFDGMRHDIWDELLQPLLMDRMDKVADLTASSLLPSETHITRKAISAGTFPDSFDPGSAEDRLLKGGLAKEFGFKGEVEVMSPEGAGTGETVRYRAGNLDVFIFELCDKELHKIQWKVLPDGREVPSRPLSYIYQQQLKNIIDTEVMAIVRELKPGTKVFVTADHGFGRVGREKIWFNAGELNEPGDCSYLNCRLRIPLEETSIPSHLRKNITSFTPLQLRMPESETVVKANQVIKKEYASIVFPRVGYAFSRPGSPFSPDAYSHGGISVQELMIPMVVLQVKDKDAGLLVMSEISGPDEIVEGETPEFRVQVRSSSGKSLFDEVRVDMEASVSPGTEVSGAGSADGDAGDKQKEPPKQVLYVAPQGAEAAFKIAPDLLEATDEERREGALTRVITVTALYRDGLRSYRKARTRRITVHLNSEVVVRRIGKTLGGILGLTPKSML